MVEPITSILDVRLPQPGTKEWKSLPESVRNRMNIAFELRNLLPDQVLPDLDTKILEELVPHALQEECPPEG